MSYLLDTHAFIWIITDDARLSAFAQECFEDPCNKIYFSTVSAWEMAIKSSIGRLKLKVPLKALIERNLESKLIKLLDVRLEHVLKVEELHYHHRDPFDRLLIAQSIVEDFQLLSADSIFKEYPVRSVW